MSQAPKPAAGGPPTAMHQRVRIFTYPKIIFIWPTMIVAFICAIIMASTGDDTVDPRDPRSQQHAQTEAAATQPPKDPLEKASAPPSRPQIRRFKSIQNVLGVTFLTVFILNLLVMSIDFPRFTVIALILLAAFLTFFLLWLNVYFDLLPPLVNFLEKIYAVANAWFYALFATAILVNLGIIYVTRYLDYWEIMPNEILHNHGPFSDLERFPTFNLKFDKEIPDILEYALMRSGRLVLHVANERKAIVMDNVLWIDSKEEELKKLMSRMEVRVTTDAEAAEPI
jgi:hypothetical protein